VKVPAGGSTVLDPGSYEKVKVKEDGTLHLLSGEYIITELNTAQRARIMVDLSDGPVSITVLSRLNIVRDVEIDMSAGPRDVNDILIQALQAETLRIKSGAVIRGILVAPNARVVFMADSSLEGAVYADRILIGEGVSFQPAQ
jgi:hypothetical protein